MKKIFFILLLFQFILLDAQTSCKYNNRSVFFGERSAHLTEAPENTVRIFLDKTGTYYPDFFIKDSELKNNCSSLSEWYKANPAKLILLCRQYKIDSTLPEENKVISLNDSIAQQYVKKINLKARNYSSVCILIHGFRKKVYGKIDASASYSLDENARLRKKLMSDSTQKMFFVEVYYDCKTITPIQCYRHKGFRLFENAGIPNADNAGLALRRIIPLMENQNLNIIAHSVGARVVCELLFNASKGNLKEESKLPTPSQNKIKICFMAPAVGADFFNQYYSRTTLRDFKTSDNYKICILYNENDFVLLKHYGFGVNASPVRFGNTSLGCNFNGDLQKLNELFKTQFPNSYAPVLFNCSIGNSGWPMGCHLVACYSRHNQFLNVMNFFGK